MEIKVIDREDGKMVMPIGEIDMNTSMRLRKEFLKLHHFQPKVLFVNLERVSYIDSSGLATLIECMQEMEKYGGTLKLIISQPHILDVFKLARLDTVFQIYPTVPK